MALIFFDIIFGHLNSYFLSEILPTNMHQLLLLEYEKKIHQHGKTLSASELIQEISGETLTNQYFLNYLENKFSELYDLKL